MSLIPDSLERLTESFARLPGVGPKTAQRLSFFCLRSSADVSKQLAGALDSLHDTVRACSQCFFIAEGPLCAICSSTRRDRAQICVVEEPLDVLAVERSGEFHGLYHVLEGALSPIEGVGPNQIRVSELEHRVAAGEV